MQLNLFGIPVGGRDIGSSAAPTKNLCHRAQQDIELTQTKPHIHFLREEDLKCLKMVVFGPIPSNEPFLHIFLDDPL